MAYNHQIEGEGQRRIPLLKAFVVVHVLRVRCNDACPVFQTVVKSAQDNQEDIKSPPYERASCGIHVDMILRRDRRGVSIARPQLTAVQNPGRW